MHVAGSVAAHHRLTPADCGYCCLPLFHINAEVVGLLGTLAAGACLVIDRKFSRDPGDGPGRPGSDRAGSG
jgi:acyl-CoA synthetase (AMP-forming)/AMP-acid ligase II